MMHAVHLVVVCHIQDISLLWLWLTEVCHSLEKWEPSHTCMLWYFPIATIYLTEASSSMKFCLQAAISPCGHCLYSGLKKNSAKLSWEHSPVAVSEWYKSFVTGALQSWLVSRCWLASCTSFSMTFHVCDILLGIKHEFKKQIYCHFGNQAF